MSSGPTPEKKEEAPADPGTTRPRVTWWQIASVSLFAALLGGALYYGSALARSSAFKDERAFRVLGEVATQIGNLQTSRATLLTSMDPLMIAVMAPCTEGAAPRIPVPEPSGGGLFATFKKQIVNNIHRLYANYLARLDLFDANFCAAEAPGEAAPETSATGARPEAPAKPAGSPAPAAPARPAAAVEESQIGRVIARACAGAAANEVAQSLSLQNQRLISVWCKNGTRVALQESAERAVATFIAQDFFDEALLALPNGEVLGEFPLHDPGSNDNRVRLHASIADRFNILNARGLLEAPRAGGEDDAKTPQAKVAVGLGPVAFDHEIAGQAHRVFVLPFRAPYRLSLADPTGAASADAATGNHLFLVGVKRVALAEDIVHSLWPLGLWILTLVICVSLLAWPLLSLAFGPAEESFSIRKAVACAVGLLAVPAVLAIAAASLWSNFELQSWMRVRASTYAQELARQLHDDVRDGAEILTSYRGLYGLYRGETNLPRCSDTRSQEIDRSLLALIPRCGSGAHTRIGPIIGLGPKHERLRSCLMVEEDEPKVCTTVRIQQQHTVPGARHWSPLRTVLAVNANGERFGPVLTLFNNVPVKGSLNLSNREYFQALKHGQYWLMRRPGGERVQLVAQRLYNRGDASKALQIVVPLCDPVADSDRANFCGLVTGDLRMHGLIAPVAPSLLKFAIIDSSSGTVLFHSNDSRGLAENFFRESERNPALFAAIRSRGSGAFVGRYLGDPYSFVYTPVREMPWGVVVFYSRKELGDLPFRAGSAALSAYVGTVIAVLIVLFFARWALSLFWQRTPTVAQCVERCWPTVPLSARYRHGTRFRPSLIALLALFVLVLAGASPWMLTGVIALLLLLAAVSGLLNKVAGEERSARTPAQQYIEFLAIVLTAVSIVPAFAYFLTFHRLQIDALAHDGLVQAGNQVQRRFELIRQDLRRWVPPNGQEWSAGVRRFPDAWSLTLQPDRNLTGVSRRVPAELTIRRLAPLVSRQDVEQRPTSLIERLVWQATVGSAEQQRRIALLDGRTAAGPIDCGTIRRGTVDRCIMTMSDGGRIAIDAPPAPRRNLLHQDAEFAWPRIVAMLAALAGLALGTWALARLFTVRLIGLGASYTTRPSRPARQSCPYDAAKFASVWRDQLDQPERLILFQLASSHLVNPRNDAAIERLIDLGLIRLRPWPRLAWPELKDLILHSQSAREFARWQSDAGKGTWKTIRLPLFILLMALIAWLSWAAGGSVKALSAVLLATIALLGQLAQLFNFLKTGQAKSGS